MTDSPNPDFREMLKVWIVQAEQDDEGYRLEDALDDDVWTEEELQALESIRDELNAENEGVH